MTRVTIDHDSFDELRDVATFYNMKAMFGNCSVRWSWNRRGLHFRSFTTLTELEAISIRYLFQDDEVRIELDSSIVEKAKNVLFTSMSWSDDIYTAIRPSYMYLHRQKSLNRRKIIRNSVLE